MHSLCRKQHCVIMVVLTSRELENQVEGKTEFENLKLKKIEKETKEEKEQKVLHDFCRRQNSWFQAVKKSHSKWLKEKEKGLVRKVHKASGRAGSRFSYEVPRDCCHCLRLSVLPFPLLTLGPGRQKDGLRRVGLASSPLSTSHEKNHAFC